MVTLAACTWMLLSASPQTNLWLSCLVAAPAIIGRWCETGGGQHLAHYLPGHDGVVEVDPQERGFPPSATGFESVLLSWHILSADLPVHCKLRLLVVVREAGTVAVAVDPSDEVVA
jgi:hypothetical protein